MDAGNHAVIAKLWQRNGVVITDIYLKNEQWILTPSRTTLYRDNMMHKGPFN